MSLELRRSPPLQNAALNALYAAAWPGHEEADFSRVLGRSLGWVGAFEETLLVGFVYLAWDGGGHAFLLDPTVHPKHQGRGLGTRLVKEAVALAKEAGLAWVHVDFEPHLAGFYRGCGFRPSEAGLVNLREGG